MKKPKFCNVGKTCQTFKTDFFIADEEAKKARVFVPGKRFQLAGKDGAWLSGVPFRRSPSRQAPGLTRLLKLTKDKHSSLFGLFIGDKEKKSLITSLPGSTFLTPTSPNPALPRQRSGTYNIKLFFIIIYILAKHEKGFYE
jgi:hypothetical protein